MLNITKENNSIRVEATDYSFYPFNGVVTYPLNSVIVVTDKSNMATFKSSTNGDVLFVGNINELTIGGENVTKDTIVDTFTKIANSSGSSIDTSDFAKKTDLDTLSAEVEHKADKTSVYTIEETDGKLDKKQNKLVAGENITLTDNTTDGTTTIAAAGGGVNGLVIDENKVTAGLNQRLNDGITDVVAIGNKAYVNHDGNIAIGNVAISSGIDSLAIGNTSASTTNQTTAIGNSSEASAQRATAIGYGATANNSDTIAVGNESNAYNEGATALGSNTTADFRYCTAIGYSAHATSKNPLIINAGSDGGYTPYSMIQGDHTGKISLLAGDGTENRMVIQDEVNVLKTKKQDKLVAGDNITLTENTADGTVTIASTGGSGGTVDAYTKTESDAKYALKTDHETLAGEVATLEADKQDKLTAGTGITIDGNTISATGGGSENQYIKVNEKNIAIGNNANSYEANNTICIGTNAQSNGNSSIVIGGVQSVATEAITIGYGGNNGGNNSVAIGSVATVGDDVAQGVAIGPNANATAEYPLSIKAGGTSVFASKEMLKGDPNGKLYVIDGSATMCLQDEINALKNSGGGSGSVSGLTIDNNQVTAGLNQTTTGGTNIVAIGNSTTASNDSSIAIGEFAISTGLNSLAAGYNANAAEKYCVAIGSGATANAGVSVAIGSNARASIFNGVAIGSNARASADNPLVIKAGSDVNNDALPMIEGNNQGKIRIPIGDGTTSTMCLQDEINSLKTQLTELAAKVNGGA